LFQFLLIVSVATGGLLILLLENPNEFKAEIARVVSLNSPYEVAIDGDLTWRYWPPIAIQAADVSLISPVGDTLATFAQLEIDVDLIPLLSQQHIVDINALSIRGGWINYDVTPAGDSNWQPSGTLSQGTAAQSPPLPTLHELRIHDLTINYRAESNYRLTISHFNTSKLLTDTPFDVSAGLQIEDDDGTVNLKIDATGQLIYASNQRLRFDRLVSNIQAEPDLAFNMTASGELHPERQVILLNDAAVTYDTLIASLTGIINFAAEPRFDGELDVQTANLSKLAGTPLPVTTLQFTAGLTASPQTISISTMAGEFDRTLFKGNIDIDLNEPRRIAGDLRIDAIDFTENAGLSDAQAASTSGTNTDPEILPQSLKAYQLNLILRAERLRYADIDFSATKIDLNSNQNQLELIANTRLLNGKLVTSINSDWTDTRLVVSADRVDVSTLTESRAITGKLTGNGVYEFSGDRLSDLEANLAGQSTFSISDGSIDVRPIKTLASSIDSLRGKTSRISTWPDKQPFRTVTGQHLFQGGTRNGQILNARVENLQLTAAGGFDIARESLDYTLTALFEQGNTGAFAVSDQLAGIRWPLRCQGSFNEPPADLCFGQQGAIEELVKSVARQELKRKGNRKLDQLIEEKVPEGLQDLTRDLLKDLFK